MSYVSGQTKRVTHDTRGMPRMYPLIYNVRVCDCCNTDLTGGGRQPQTAPEAIPAPPHKTIGVSAHFQPPATTPDAVKSLPPVIHLCNDCFDKNRGAIDVFLDMLKGSR